MRPTTRVLLAAVLTLALSPNPWPAPHTVVAAPVLVAAYSFNEGAGTTLTDLSGNGHNGTLANGPTWTAAGKYGGALTFDGSNDVVNIADSPTLDLTTGMTLEAWVRPTVASNWRTAIMKERPGHMAYGLYSNTSSSRPAGEISTTGSSGVVEVRGSAQLTTNTWWHVAVTFDGTLLRLYVNGNQVGSQPAGGNIVTSSNPLRIGGNTIWGEYFRGQIDDVRIYNEALTQAQIQLDMNTPVSGAPPADTVPPAVSLTAPAGGSTVSGNLTVSATASDNVGVAGVQFAVNGVNIGAEDTSAPYSVTWNSASVADGSHGLTAVARDAAGNRTTSATVTVITNNFTDVTAPTVSMTAPANGASVQGTVNLAATASDNVGVVGVQFAVNGVNIGAEDTGAPYSVTWNSTSVADGSHDLTAVARDAAGNRTTSATVTVIVDNFTDVTGPSVSMTAPADGASVQGTVSLGASASDDVGVVGVQFAVNGVNVGAEDTSLPYSVTWNSTSVANGSHGVTAVARDAAGNRTTSATVTVIVDNFTDVTAPTVSMTAPADGASVQGTVSLGASASDDVGVVSVQFTVNGTNIAAPDTAPPYSASWNTAQGANGTYTLAAIARDAANNFRTSAPVTVVVNNSIDLGVLNGHPVAGDSSNAIVSWLGPEDTAYELAMEIAWDFLLNRVPTENNGIKSIFTQSYLHSGSLWPSGWENNPADKNAGIIESALRFYAYSGDSRVISLARELADYQLDNGMTAANGVWPSVPYASGCGGCLIFDGTGSDGQGYIEPDKVASLGLQLLRLYQQTGVTRYRDAALASANALAANVRTGNATASPWPFRVHAQDGTIKEDYTAHVIPAIEFLEAMAELNLGNVAAYQAARTTALTWLMAYPMQNGVWVNYFEDVGVQSGLGNINNVSPLETAYHLLQHPEDDPDWRVHVPSLIAWVENHLGVSQFGANAIKEQAVFPFPMGSHTARYAAVNALYYELTGNTAARDKAYRAYNWATYMISSSPQGQIIDGPDVNNIWFSDGYGDFIRHFMRGIAAVPAWAPNNETHILDSTAVIKAVTYSPNAVDYTTDIARSVEKIKVNFIPRDVTAGGNVLPQRTDLSAPGWVYDPSSRLLSIRHDTGTQIHVSDTAAVDAIAPAISGVGAANITANSATISWATDELADAQIEYGTTPDYTGATAVSGLALSHSVTIPSLSAETVYYYRVKSRDVSGNLATADGFMFVTLGADTSAPVVHITAPADASVVAGTGAITADASDNVGVVGVRFLLNGANLGAEDTTAPYAISWNTTSVPNGSYALTSIARDAAGNSASSAAIVVTVDNRVDTTGPTVSVTAPVEGSPVAGSVVLSADAVDDFGVVGVQFLLNGANLGAEDTTAPYSLTWDSTGVQNGAYTISARARDAAGNASTSTAVSIHVDNPQVIAVDFNDYPSQHVSLDGQYPSGVINWGTNVWYLSGPFGQFTTKSVSFNRPGITSGTFGFVTPKRLISVRAYNGGSTTTLTFSCSGNPTRTVSVGANQLQTISMTWGVSCSTVTFTSSNGWDTNLDDFIFDGGL